MTTGQRARNYRQRAKYPHLVKVLTGATVNLEAGDLNRIFLLSRAGSSVIVPPDPTTVAPGTWFTVLQSGDELVNVNPDGSGNVGTLDSLTSNSVNLGTTGEQIGQGLTFVSDGTRWLLIAHLSYGNGTGTHLTIT